MDLLQLLILLAITGICGAAAVLALGFSPRGVMILIFSVIVGTIGAALGNWVNAYIAIPDLLEVRVGTIRIGIIRSILGSVAVVGLLMGLQGLVSPSERAKPAAPPPDPAAQPNAET